MNSIENVLKAKIQRQMEEIEEGLHNQTDISDKEIDEEIKAFKQSIRFISKPINDDDPWVKEMLSKEQE